MRADDDAMGKWRYGWNEKRGKRRGGERVKNDEDEDEVWFPSG